MNFLIKIVLKGQKAVFFQRKVIDKHECRHTSIRQGTFGGEKVNLICCLTTIHSIMVKKEL